MLPGKFITLDRREKAYVIAAIQIKTENDKKKEQEAKRNGKKGRSRSGRS